MVSVRIKKRLAFQPPHWDLVAEFLFNPTFREMKPLRVNYS